MKEINIVFEGRVPIKKNSRIGLRNGMNLPSKAYRSWHKEQIKKLIGLDSITGAFSIEYRFYIGSLMKFDQSNTIESINDILVDAGILPEDNWVYLRNGKFEFAGFDWAKPRCEVRLVEIEDRFLEHLRLLSDKDLFRQKAKENSMTQKAFEQYLKEEMVKLSA